MENAWEKLKWPQLLLRNKLYEEYIIRSHFCPKKFNCLLLKVSHENTARQNANKCNTLRKFRTRFQNVNNSDFDDYKIVHWHGRILYSYCTKEFINIEIRNQNMYVGNKEFIWIWKFHLKLKKSLCRRRIESSECSTSKFIQNVQYSRMNSYSIIWNDTNIESVLARNLTSIMGLIIIFD